ncbi:MAG: ATP-binding protein [Myxococcota bacterium]
MAPDRMQVYAMSPDWRDAVVDQALLWLVGIHLGCFAVFVMCIPLLGGSGFGLAAPVLFVSLIALMVYSHARRSFPIRAVVLIGVLVFDQIVLGAHYGWAPTVVCAALLGAIFAGLFFGWRGVLSMAALNATLLGVGGVAVQSGWQPSLALDTTERLVWLRAGLMVGALTGLFSLFLQRVVAGLGHLEIRQSRLWASLAEEVAATRQTHAARRRAVEHLHDAQRLRVFEEMNGGITQLLHNILVIIWSAAADLRTSRSVSDNQRAAAEVSDAVKRSAAVLRALLSFTRASERPAGPVDLGGALVGLLESINPALPEDISIAVDIREPVRTYGDEARLRQLLLDLIFNARDAQPGGGAITIRLRREPIGMGQQAVIEVFDRGAGFTPEALVLAARPFFTTRDTSTHSGLGLFATQELVEEWGGRLQWGNRPDGGAMVRVTLPALDAIPDPRPPEEQRLALTDRWRRDAVRRLGYGLLTVQGLSYLLLVVMNQEFDPAAHLIALMMLPTALVLVIGDRWSVETRGMVLVRILFGTAAGSLIRSGMLAPVATAAAVSAVWLSGFYMPRRGPVFGALMLSVLFIGIPWLPIPIESVNQDPTIATNWFRLALSFPMILLLMSSAVTDILGTGRHAVETSRRALLSLRAEQQAHAVEEARLKGTTQVVAHARRSAERSRIAGAIAHDVNNAFTAVLSWADILQEADLEPDDARHAADAFEDAARHVASLIGGFGGGLISAGPSDRVIDVGEVIQRSDRFLQHLLGPGRQLSLEVPREPLGVGISDQALRRILNNLVSNARDATGWDGAVQLSARSEGDAVIIEVRDNGEGMDAATQARALEPYFTTRAAGEGTGLGLSTVMELLNASGGALTIHSSSGVGTTMHLRWPRQPLPIPTAAPHSPQAITGGARRARILVVEDDEQIRPLLVRILQRAGFTTAQAGDGDQALATIGGDTGWDLLLTDAVFPGAPLPAVLDAFSAAYPTAPIVICSGYLPRRFAERVGDRSVIFFPKPFQPARLVATVHDALDRS